MKDFLTTKIEKLRTLTKKDLRTKTTIYFILVNVLLLIVHSLTIKSLTTIPLTISKDFLGVFLIPGLYLTILPLLIFYIVAFIIKALKSNIDLKTYSAGCFIILFIYFICAINKYYPDCIINKLMDDYRYMQSINEQAKNQEKLKKELKDYQQLETVKDISIYFNTIDEKLILQYQDYYEIYNTITNEEYNKIFEIGQNYDYSLRETVYTKNESYYKIISSSFFTYITIDDENGFLVWTYKDFDGNEILKESLDKIIYDDKNKISIGQELTNILYEFDEVEPFQKNEIKKDGDKVIVTGTTTDYRWNIVKDKNFEFTLKEETLDLKSANFSDSGEYVIKLEKKSGNSYIVCSNELIVKIN